jgi:hypothetical protein
VEFTAYAFNEDRVKSETSAPIIYPLLKPRPAITSRRAYLITVGVDATTASTWRLLFAPTGAREIEKLLNDKLQSKYEIVPVQLISEFNDDGLDLKQDLPTKSNVRAVMNILSGQTLSVDKRVRIPNYKRLRPATPDDLVFIYIASHGYADPKGMFYIVPSDLGLSAERVSEALLTRCLTMAKLSENCLVARSFLEHTISSEELTDWLKTIDAGEMTLILDSCHSAAVSGPNFKPGPMGDRGFGQLSYDKGMLVLAATQVENLAWGTLELGDRSLLTDALINQARQFQTEPFNLRQWLSLAQKKVPESFRKYVPQGTQQEQEPALFDFAK